MTSTATGSGFTGLLHVRSIIGTGANSRPMTTSASQTPAGCRNTRLLLRFDFRHHLLMYSRATARLGHPHRRIFRDDEHDRQRRFLAAAPARKTP